MKEWARNLLIKTDHVWQSSQQSEGVVPISLASRNAVGMFCSFVKAEANHWFMAAGDNGGIDIDVDIGKCRYSFEFFANGTYRWTNYIRGFEVVGGGENQITQAGIDLCFFEPPTPR